MDVAEFMEQLTPLQQITCFRTLPKDQASDVFAELEPETQQNIISAITDQELSPIIEDLFVDDAVDMLEEMPAMVVKRVLKNAKPETRTLINQFLKYPEDSTGSIMTAEFLDLHKDMTVLQAIDRIRKRGEESEQIYTCYVTNHKRILEGVVTVKDLLMPPYEAKIGSIMEDNVIKCVTTDDQEDVADLFNRYDLLSMPVVDQENRLVGLISVDDVVDVMEDEATEDMEKMAAIIPTERPYFKTSVFETWKSRIPWLTVLMVSATFTAIILTAFENQLAACAALTGFIPMLMGIGGNSGSQASVTVIRATSLGDVEFKDFFRVIWKEIRVGALCGVSLAAVNFIKIWLVDKLLLGHDITLMVDLVVCATSAAVVVFAKTVGAMLPLLMEKLGFDPAVMASPFISTVMDAMSLLIYFLFAHLLLGI